MTAEEIEIRLSGARSDFSYFIGFFTLMWIIVHFYDDRTILMTASGMLVCHGAYYIYYRFRCRNIIKQYNPEEE